MDARSLLRAKKAEARIEHPYATYNASGQLRCSICAVPVKQWDAHLLTKQHRTSLSREKAELAKQALKTTKRPAPPPEPTSSKRAKLEDEDVQKGNGKGKGKSNLPAGFFSSGNGGSVAIDDDDEEEEEDVAELDNSGPLSIPPMTVIPAQTGDTDLDDFLASLNDDSDPILTPSTAQSTAVPNTATAKPGTRYKSSATDIPSVASYEAAPVRNIPDGEGGDAPGEVGEPEESEAQKRERATKEEREELMGRLEDEERAQEDADSRVMNLKARMELLKKRRQTKPKQTKTDPPQPPL